MGFNKNTLPASVVGTMFKGLEGQYEPVIKQLAGQKELVTSLTGTLPALTSASMLARADMGGGIAPGAVSKENDVDVETFDYKIKRFQGRTILPDHIRIDLDGYKNMKALETFGRQCMITSTYKVNAETQTLLSSTSLNETGSVNNGAWSSSSSTPLVDLDQIFDAIGDGDTLFLGRDIRKDLVKHPDIIAETSNFSAGAVNVGKLLDVLFKLYPHLTNIVIGESMYNTANEGQAVSIGFQFDGLVWAGWSDALAWVEQTGVNKHEVERISAARGFEISYEESCDQVRTTKEKGYVLTGA